MTTPDTRAKELAGLIERVEAATGPDRELDVLIPAILFGWPEIDPTTLSGGKPGDRAFDNSNDPDWRFGCQPFSSSTDAALALVERMTDDPEITVSNVSKKAWKCAIWIGNDETDGQYRSAPTAPLAIILALLKALAQESHDAQ